MCSDAVISVRLEVETCLASVVVEQFNEYAGQLAFHVHSLCMGSKIILLAKYRKLPIYTQRITERRFSFNIILL